MKAPRLKVPVTDILAWLAQNFPDLHAKAEVERSWCWLPVDLRGDQNKEKRERIKEYGFRWAKRGHPLPSGAVGTWAHAGTHPTPFKRHVKGGASKQTNGAEHESNLESEIDRALQEVGV